MEEIKHPLGETVTAHRAFEILADFDGNAPDSSGMVIVATKALADEVINLIKDVAVKDGESVHYHGTEYQINTPVVEGWEHSKSYKYRNVVAAADEIKTTVSEALISMGNSY